MSGILSSCCPFLTNTTREGRGSPPYSADDMRLRLHNWTNSLSGSTQIPRSVAASTKDKPGLPPLSTDSSAISFVKSDTSIDPGEGEGVCKVIFPAREGCSQMDQAMAAAVAADFHPLPDGDWETEKGSEEEEVTLLQRRQAGDDEGDGMCLERKMAKTTLPLKPHEDPRELATALPYKSKTPANPTSLPNIPEKSSESVSLSGVVLDTTSPAPPLQTPQEPHGASTSMDVEVDVESSQEMLDASTTVPIETPAESPSTPRVSSPSSAPLPAEELTQASSSSELLGAISSLSAARGSGKSRRSRMTSTRAPTPWSAAERDEDEDGAPAEDEPLDRAASSDSDSPYESVAGTAESSYHTLPTPTSSAEHVGGADGQQTATAAAAVAAETKAETTAGDQAPPAAGQDDVSLRYFCGEFRPDDHFMSRHAGLEAVTPVAEVKRSLVTPGRSESAVTPAAETVSRRGRGAASDSTLPLGGRGSSPGPPAADGSGVLLEAKRSDTTLLM